jgi:hypothetical protein
MSAFNNQGSAEWQALASPRPQRGVRQPSRRHLELEEELRQLLARYALPDIEGAWLDWRDGRREPLFVPAPGAEDAP